MGKGNEVDFKEGKIRTGLVREAEEWGRGIEQGGRNTRTERGQRYRAPN